MKEIVVASNNKEKIKEIEAILSEIYGGELKLLSLSDIGFTEKIEETGETFSENAEIKAMAVAKLGYTAIADDSGLCVEALNGAPGVHSARFAGEPCNDEANINKLLTLMTDVPDELRKAKFVSAICCVTPDGREIFAHGECDGKIIREPKGKNGFGYDPVFKCCSCVTFAQISPEEKNKISHRAKAIRNFAELAKQTKIFD